MDEHGRLSSQIQQIHAFQILRCIWERTSWSWHPHRKCTAAIVTYIMVIWSFHHRGYRIKPEWPECVVVCQGWQENEKVRFNNCWNVKTTSTCCPTSCMYRCPAFGPQAEEADIIMVSYALEDALFCKNIIKVLSDNIGVLALPVYLCHDKALQCKLQMESWDSTALDINAICVELKVKVKQSTKCLQLPGM